MPALDPLLNPPSTAPCEPIESSGTAEHLRYYAVYPCEASISIEQPRMILGCCTELRFGVLVYFDQEWKDRGLTRGKLISSVFVPPGPGEVQVTERTWQTNRYERSDSTQLDAAFSRSIQVRDSDAKSVSKRTSISNTRSTSGSAGIRIGPLDAGGQASSSTSLQSSVEDTRNLLSEQTENAAWEEKQSRVSTVNVISEVGDERTVIRTFRNPSLSKGVSYDYYEIIQNYAVFTHESGTQLVLLVPRIRPVITAQWLRCHEWILKPVLKLDNAAELFNEIRWGGVLARESSQSSGLLSTSDQDRGVQIVKDLIDLFDSPGYGLHIRHCLYASMKAAKNASASSKESCIRIAGDAFAAKGWSVDYHIDLDDVPSNLTLAQAIIIHELFNDWWHYIPDDKEEAEELAQELKLIYGNLQSAEQIKAQGPSESERRFERAVEILRCHIQEHFNYYLEIIWSAESPSDRACYISRMYPDLMPALWKVVRNELIGVISGCMILPLSDQIAQRKVGKLEAGHIATLVKEVTAIGGEVFGEVFDDPKGQAQEILKKPDLKNIGEWLKSACSRVEGIAPTNAKARLAKEKLNGALSRLTMMVRLAEGKAADFSAKAIEDLIKDANNKRVARSNAVEDLIKLAKKDKAAAPARPTRLERLATYAEQTRSSKFVFSSAKFSEIYSQSRTIDSDALDLAKRQAHCIFVQLPSPGMLVEPRLTQCDAWSEDVRKEWEVRLEKSSLENKLLELKRMRHEARLKLAPPNLDYPDFDRSFSVHATVRTENAQPLADDG